MTLEQLEALIGPPELIQYLKRPIDLGGGKIFVGLSNPSSDTRIAFWSCQGSIGYALSDCAATEGPEGAWTIIRVCPIHAHFFEEG